MLNNMQYMLINMQYILYNTQYILNIYYNIQFLQKIKANTMPLLVL